MAAIISAPKSLGLHYCMHSPARYCWQTTLLRTGPLHKVTAKRCSLNNGKIIRSSVLSIVLVTLATNLQFPDTTQYSLPRDPVFYLQLNSLSDTMASHHIINQPMSLASMDPYSDYNHDEKRHTTTSVCHHCECADTNHSLPHRACRKSRLRRLLIPALVSIATVATIFVISCIRNLEILAAFLPDDGVLGLGKRALGAGDTTGSDQSSFVHKKCVSSLVWPSLGVGWAHR
jgi:hypothetical protein